jgi:hypothetical protein
MPDNHVVQLGKCEMIQRVLAISFFSLSMVSLLAHAQIYKWVDANGKTHYGDAPPQSGQARAEVVKTPPILEPGKPGPSWEEKDREFRRRKIEREAMSAKDEVAPTSQQICASARYKLQTLDGKLIYRIDKKTGERVYMEDSERAAIEKKAKQDIATHCPR